MKNHKYIQITIGIKAFETMWVCHRSNHYSPCSVLLCSSFVQTMSLWWPLKWLKTLMQTIRTTYHLRDYVILSTPHYSLLSKNVKRRKTGSKPLGKMSWLPAAIPIRLSFHRPGNTLSWNIYYLIYCSANIDFKLSLCSVFLSSTFSKVINSDSP